MRFLPDPGFTFDTFVTGPGSRMAAAAARRAAESPGTSYNPLYLYGPPGVGKTHLLRAVGDLALTVRPEMVVLYATMEQVVDDVSEAVAAGTLDRWREGWAEAGLVLLDDVQALSGRGRTQEELLRVWEEAGRGGTQLVLAADRPPAEIPGLDERLRARLAGGLAVDLTPAEAETRAGIVEKWAETARIPLAAGVAEEVARLPLDGAADLQRAVERLGEEQRTRQGTLAPDEVAALLVPPSAGPAPVDEFSAFLSDIAFTVEQLVEAAPWRRTVAEAILRWEGEGIRTRRLEETLEADSAPDVEALVESFAADVARLRALEAELAALDAEAAKSPVLRDPDRLAEAEAMLAAARDAARRRAADAAAAPARPAGPPVDRWFLNAEKLAWSWTALEDRLVEELG